MTANKVPIKCFYCAKTFYRKRGRYNEAKREGWNQYCSKECQRKSKIIRIEKVCGNPKCNKTVFRLPKEIKRSKSGLVFCSLSCAVSTNNHIIPKRKVALKKEARKKQCNYCGKEFVGSGKKYCSTKCQSGSQVITEEKIIKKIQDFHRKNERIPVKKEFFHYNAARNRFGSWNNAVKAAGFKPNPVIFANKHRAKDGHRCDSLSEKIIDDWLFKNSLKHKINISYPENIKLTYDFIVNDYFIEFFGLEGEHRRYTELVKEKKKLAKKYNLNLIELKPGDLFPENKLDNVLSFLLN